MTETIKDHFGNEYKSKRSMCKAYGVYPTTFTGRRANGLSLEDALTLSKAPRTHISTAKPCQDHLGNNYPTISEMLESYKIEPSIYYKYCKTMSFEEILEKYNPLVDATDHLGKKYRSRRAMCKAYNINDKTFLDRITNGMSLEDALTLPNQNFGGTIEFNGVTYNDEKEMCDEYNILHVTYLKRRQNGWSIESALTTPLNQSMIKDRTGETKTSRYGQKMTIIEYRSTKDIDVQFEDGGTVTTSYIQFSMNYLKNPKLKTGNKVPQIAYELDNGTIALYYKCEKCGLSDVGTWQQITAHQCQKNNNQIGNLTSLPVQQYNNKK